MGDVPLNCLLQSRIECMSRSPFQFRFYLGRVYRIATVVTRTVRNKPLQVCVTLNVFVTKLRVLTRRHTFLENRAYQVDNLPICPFIFPPDIIVFPYSSLPKNEQDGLT